MQSNLNSLEVMWDAQRLDNELQLMAHERIGDSLTSKRWVSHLATFQLETHARLFQVSLEDEGYKTQLTVNGSGWRVVFARADALTPESIGSITYALVAAAVSFEGRYEGWTAFSVRQSSAT